jgi:hypothetical protein
LAATANGAVVFVSLLLLGAYYAATDGVVVAAACAMVPAAQRGNGLALITTAISAARLVASVAFGWLWTTLGRDAAIVVFGSALSLGLAIAAVSFNRREWSTHE